MLPMLPVIPLDLDFAKKFHVLRERLVSIVSSHLAKLSEKKQPPPKSFSLKLLAGSKSDSTQNPELDLYAQLIERIEQVAANPPKQKFIFLTDVHYSDEEFLEFLKYLFSMAAKEPLRLCIGELLNECANFFDHIYAAENLESFIKSIKLESLPSTDPTRQFITRINITRKLYADKFDLYVDTVIDFVKSKKQAWDPKDVHAAYAQLLACLELLRTTTSAWEVNQAKQQYKTSLQEIEGRLNCFMHAYFANSLGSRHSRHIRHSEILDQVLHYLCPDKFPAVASIITQSAIIESSKLDDDADDALRELTRLWLLGFEKQTLTLQINGNISPSVINKIIILLTLHPARNISVFYALEEINKNNTIEYILGTALYLNNDIESITINEKKCDYKKLQEQQPLLPANDILDYKLKFAEASKQLKQVENAMAQNLDLSIIAKLIESVKKFRDDNSVGALSASFTMTFSYSVICIELNKHITNRVNQITEITDTNVDTIKNLLQWAFWFYSQGFFAKEQDNFRKQFKDAKEHNSFRKNFKELCEFSLKAPEYIWDVVQPHLNNIPPDSQFHDRAMETLGRFHLSYATLEQVFFAENEESPAGPLVESKEIFRSEKKLLCHITAIAYFTSIDKTDDKNEIQHLINSQYARLIGRDESEAFPDKCKSLHVDYPERYLKALFWVYQAKAALKHQLAKIRWELLQQIHLLREIYRKKEVEFKLEVVLGIPKPDADELMADISNIFNLPVIAVIRDEKVGDYIKDNGASFNLAALEEYLERIFKIGVNFDALDEKNNNLFDRFFGYTAGDQLTQCLRLITRYISLNTRDMHSNGEKRITRFAKQFERGKWEAIKLILEHSKETLLLDDTIDGKSLLQMALDCNHQLRVDIVELLLARGANPFKARLAPISGNVPSKMVDEHNSICVLLENSRFEYYEKQQATIAKQQTTITTLQQENTSLRDQNDHLSQQLAEQAKTAESDPFKKTYAPRMF